MAFMHTRTHKDMHGLDNLIDSIKKFIDSTALKEYYSKACRLICVTSTAKKIFIPKPSITLD